MPGGYLIGFLIERWQSIGAVLELASRVAAISLLGTKAKSRNRGTHRM
jgi:hypothetical protein